MNYNFRPAIRCSKNEEIELTCEDNNKICSIKLKEGKRILRKLEIN